MAFYGCGPGQRVVRLALKEHDDRHVVKYPRVVELRCPACGEPHRMALMWRVLNDGEELRAEVLI